MGEFTNSLEITGFDSRNNNDTHTLLASLLSLLRRLG
jgi:hypothetical protein